MIQHCNPCVDPTYICNCSCTCGYILSCATFCNPMASLPLMPSVATHLSPPEVGKRSSHSPQPLLSGLLGKNGMCSSLPKGAHVCCFKLQACVTGRKPRLRSILRAHNQDVKATSCTSSTSWIHTGRTSKAK